MGEDLTVLLVGDVDPDSKLFEQLEKKELTVEISALGEFESLLALVEPHLVVHIGREGAERTAEILKATEEVRRVRLIVIADRDALPDLRHLDKTVVVSVLATDIAPSVVAARVLMLAKKGPGKSLRPPAATGSRTARAETPGATAQATQAAVQAPKAGGQLPKSAGQTAPLAAQAPRAIAPTPQATPRAPIASEVPVGVAAASIKPPREQASQEANKPGKFQATASLRPKPPHVVTKTATKASPTTTSPTPIPPSYDAPPSGGPTVMFQAPIPAAAIPAPAAARVLLADNDFLRADLIACALRAAGIETRIVPLDAAATHWSLVRDFGPNILLGDGNLLKTTGQVWLQLFQADQALKKAKLVAVPFERLFNLQDGKVNLRTLIPQIPQLSGEVPSETKAATAPAPVLPAIAHQSLTSFSDEDDESEFDRMTVAREIPLPREASPSLIPFMPDDSKASSRLDDEKDRATVVPPSADTLPSQPQELSGITPAKLPFALPLPPAATNTPSSATPLPTARSAKPTQSKGGGAKIALAAIAVLGAGAAGAWFIFGKNSVQAPPQAAATAPAQVPAAVPTPVQPPLEAVQASPMNPTDALWIVKPRVSAPACEDLVANKEAIQAGGVGQATLSLTQARKAMVLGDLDSALGSLCEAALAHPESLALEELASLYVSKHEPTQALNWHTKALTLRPDRAKTIEIGADIQSQLGKIPEARAALVSALKVKDDDQKVLDHVASGYVTQGEQNLKGGAFGEAERFYRRAAVLSPENVNAAAGMAATYAAAGNVEGARLWAEKTITFDDGHHVALVVLAALATEAGDKPRAIELAKKALLRDPAYAPGHQLLVQLEPPKNNPPAAAAPSEAAPNAGVSGPEETSPAPAQPAGE